MVYTVWLCYIVLCILKTAVFNFYIFQQFILIVTLCVGEIREMSVQGVLGHYKAVSMFSSLGHGSLSSLCICLPSPSSAVLQNVCIYTVIHSVSSFIEILFNWEVRKTVHVDLTADFLNHLKNDLCVMSNLFMFLSSRNDLVFLPQFPLFPTLKNSEKAVSNHCHRERLL